MAQAVNKTTGSRRGCLAPTFQVDRVACYGQQAAPQAYGKLCGSAKPDATAAHVRVVAKATCHVWTRVHVQID